MECPPESTSVMEGVKSWQWDMDNKYYTASVQIATVSNPERCLSWILDRGEALLVYCDATQVGVLLQLIFYLSLPSIAVTFMLS